jgi:PAS domain-containing protein
VLEFYSTEISEPDEPLLEVMANIGTQLGRVVERQRAERALRHSQEQLAEAQRMAHIGSWDWDIPSDTVHWSEELYRIFGLEPGKFQANYESYLEQIHPEDRELVARTIEQSLRYHTLEMEHRCSPGRAERIIYAQGKTLLDKSGQPARWSGSPWISPSAGGWNRPCGKAWPCSRTESRHPDGTVLVDEIAGSGGQPADGAFGHSR